MPKIKNIAIILGLSFLVVEVALRLFLAYKVGPEYLYYGTKWSKSGFEGTTERMQLIEKKQSVAGQPEMVLRYSKFFPNQERFDRHPITNKYYSVRINNKGFRGKDIKEEKPDSLLRIVTLGASSTFGYGDRDDETYPFFLEAILRKEIQENHFDAKIKDVEVLNFGIPHLTSDNILALFINEALPLKPDIVTFYEGINDCEKDVQLVPAALNLPKDSLPRVVLKALRDHLLVVMVPWGILRTKATHSKEYLDQFIPGKSKFFLGNLAKIKELCSANGIRLFIITQQARSMSVDAKGLTYKEEVRLISEKMGRQKGTNTDIFFLAHDRLMDDLKKWARERQVLLIDGIGILDSHREWVWSWVHLTPEGNRLLAEAIAREIMIQLRPADRNRN